MYRERRTQIAADIRPGVKGVCVASRGWKGFAEEETREEVAAKSSWTMFDSLLVRRGRRSKRTLRIHNF